MIRRSKVTTAAASSQPNNSSAVKDGQKTNKSDRFARFASKCHATDNNLTNTSSDTNNCTFHQECTRLNHKRLTKSTANTTSKTRHNHCPVPKQIALTYCFIITTIVLFTYQLDAYIREYQGPLDHISTTIRIPYYDMSCPSFSQHVESSMESSSSNGRDNENDISLWDCNVILRKKQTTINDDHDDIIQGETSQSTTESQSSTTSPPFPRIFMIGARDEAQDTFQSWQSQLLFKDNNTASPHYADEHTVFSSSQPYLKRINTLEVSNQFATSGGALRDSNTSPQQHAPHFLCRKIKWEQRLFHVYQHIFTELLATYPNDDGFVIIEDDATLLDPIALAEEVCNAHDHQIQFYSLYRSPLQRRVQWRWRRMNSKEQAPSSPYSCVYQHGTVAFYIQRQLMQQIINEHRRSFFCRFPIDMYISKFGPWYATTNEVVGHLGRGRIGSS